MSEEFQIKYKFWLGKDESTDGKRQGLGKGAIKLLEAIKETSNLGKAANKVGYSYKYAWNILKRIEKQFGQEPVKAFRGGKGGGGGVELTELGEKLLLYYKAFQNFLDTTIRSPHQWKFQGLNTPAPNVMTGRVLSIEKDENVAILKIEIPGPVKIMSIITRDSKKGLGIKKGVPVELLFKATAVSITKEEMF